MGDGDQVAKIRIEAESQTVKEAKDHVKDLNKALGDTAISNKEKIAGLSREISTYKDVIADATKGTLSSNAKMKESYFSTGEQLRKFYMEQRVGDRTMRETVQTAAGLASVMGGGSGFVRSLGAAASGFQQIDFAANAAGIGVMSLTGKTTGLTAAILQIAGPAAAGFALIMFFRSIGEEARKAAEEGVGTFVSELGGLGGNLPAEKKRLEQMLDEVKKGQEEAAFNPEGAKASREGGDVSAALKRDRERKDLLQMRYNLLTSLLTKYDEEIEKQKILTELERMRIKGKKEVSADDYSTSVLMSDIGMMSGEKSLARNYGMGEYQLPGITTAWDTFRDLRLGMIRAGSENRKTEKPQREIDKELHEYQAKYKQAFSGIEDSWNIMLGNLRSSMDKTVGIMTDELQAQFDKTWEKIFGKSESFINKMGKNFVENMLSSFTMFGSGGQGMSQIFSSGVIPLANGGIVTEPAFAMTRSGQRFTIAENGPEDVGGLKNLNRIMQSGRYTQTPTVQYVVVDGEIRGEGKSLRATLHSTDMSLRRTRYTKN